MMLGLKTLALLLSFLSTIGAVVEVNEWECWGSKYRILLKRYTDRECKNKIGEENKRDLVCSGKCKSWKKDPPFDKQTDGCKPRMRAIRHFQIAECLQAAAIGPSLSVGGYETEMSCSQAKTFQPLRPPLTLPLIAFR
ncbi:hypothetical protein LTR17_019590 [Elasticomyces elasticus]|nr:hypothetical protein LTR17_019590 [Elasticomyces elasticus]